MRYFNAVGHSCLSKDNQSKNMVNVLRRLFQYKLIVLIIPIIISKVVLRSKICAFVHVHIYIKLNGSSVCVLFFCFLFFSRIIDQRFEKVSYFVFGDFNFRLDAKAVVEVGLSFFIFIFVEMLKVT